MRRCELCSKEAALHCDADSAYLCWGCDAKVHGANFLVARHVRIVLCCRCHEYTDISTFVTCPDLENRICSGCLNSDCTDETPLRISTAESGISGRRSCSPRETSTKAGVNIASGNPVSEVSIDEWSWSNSEDSSTSPDSQPKSQQQQNKAVITRYSVQNSDMKVQAILRKWYRYLDLRSPSTVTLAMYLVEKGLHKLGGLFRQKWKICVATSFWLAATLCENKAYLPSLKRVEECTGVPSKLILVVESKMVTILDWKMHDEEGWAESSN